MNRMLFFTMVLVLSVAGARADPFFQRYEPVETFPEDQGWTRYWSDPEGKEVRTIEDGVLRLDTCASYSIFDLYYVRSGAFELNPSEELRVTWQMEALETDTTWWETDVIVGITNAESEYVELNLAPGYVAEYGYGFEEPEHVFEFDAGVAHSYEFTSDDMANYQLWVDGEFAFEGQFAFNALVGPNWLGFGDTYIGLRSLSEWKYVQIEVVPEPASVVLFCWTALVVVHTLRRKQ